MNTDNNLYVYRLKLLILPARNMNGTKKPIIVIKPLTQSKRNVGDCRRLMSNIVASILLTASGHSLQPSSSSSRSFHVGSLVTDIV